MGLIEDSCDQAVGEIHTNFWVLYVLRTIVLKQVVIAGKYGLGCDELVVCQCRTWTDMLNCVYCIGSEHEDPIFCVVS